MQAANDEEGAVGQRIWGTKGQGFEKAPPLHSDLFSGWQVANEISKSKLTEIPTIHQYYWLRKLQPEMEIFNRK